MVAAAATDGAEADKGPLQEVLAALAANRAAAENLRVRCGYCEACLATQSSARRCLVNRAAAAAAAGHSGAQVRISSTSAAAIGNRTGNDDAVYILLRWRMCWGEAQKMKQELLGVFFQKPANAVPVSVCFGAFFELVVKQTDPPLLILAIITCFFCQKRQGASCRQGAGTGCQIPAPCWTHQVQ